MSDLITAALNAHLEARAAARAEQERHDRERKEREAEEQAEAMELVKGAFVHHYGPGVPILGLAPVKINRWRDRIVDVVVELTDVDVVHDLRNTIRLIIGVDGDPPQIAVADAGWGPMPRYGKRLHTLAELGQHIEDVRQRAREKACPGQYAPEG